MRNGFGEQGVVIEREELNAAMERLRGQLRFSEAPRYDVCQGAQCRLYLRYRAGILDNEVAVRGEPFGRKS